MRALHGVVRPYPWGSRTALARIQGRPVPSPGPEAELWLGGHPGAPSTVDTADGVPLTDLITKDPVGVLGPATLDGYGPRLPYLLKVLAADQPLSLQAHPDADQAAARFAVGDPSYVDAYHKPELLVALEDFEALCGFRPPAESAELLSTLDVPELAPVVSRLDGPGPDGERLRAAVTALLSWPVPERAALVSTVASRGGLAARLAGRYPGDIGVLVALLLNQVTLRPDQAIWMPAGNLHCYLRGTGVEVMAASDNVLRGGLTGKTVDVPGLLSVLRFEVLADPVRRPVELASGLVSWPVPVPDFALYRAVPEESTVEVPAAAPRIVVCLAGRVSVDDGRGAVALRTGQAAFGDATGSVLTVAGSGTAYIAAPGSPR